MKRTLLLLFVIITIVFAQKRTYKIGLLVDKLTIKTADHIQEKLQKEVKAVVGEDAHIIFDKKDILQNNYEVEKAKSNYQKLLKTCDIILSFGSYDAQVLKQEKEYPKPVIVIGQFHGMNKIDENTTSNINNLLYLTYSGNILTNLNILKELVKFEKVGIVIGENIAKIEGFKEKYQQLLSENKINYKLIPYQNLDDIINNLDGIDALNLENSFSLTSDDIKKLSKILIEKKIPSFSSIRFLDVVNGIMATDVSDSNLERFFRRVALSVNSYINGTNFSKLPVLIDFTPEVTVNYTTAMALGVPLNYSMLGEIDFVGKSSINPNAEKVYNLPEFIAEVLNNNLSLKSETKEVAIGKQGISSAKSSYLPSLKANAQAVYLDPEIAKLSQGSNAELTTSGNLTLQQLVFSEEANTNIRIQKSLAKIRQEQFNTKQLDLIFNAVNAYFNVLILKSNVRIQLNNLSLTKYNLQIAEENYNAGQSGITDLLRFRSQKAQNTQSLIKAINQLQKSYNYLNQLTNKNLGYRIDIKETTLSDSIFHDYNYDKFMDFTNTPSLRKIFIKFLIQEAIHNAPEIKQLSHSLKVAKNKIKLYGWKRFLPQVALQGQYNYQFSKSGEGSSYPAGYPSPPDGNYNIGLNISLPIFNKNSNSINKQTALIQEEQLEINKENFQTAVSLNIYNAILDLINEISNIELSKVSEKAAQKALELTQNAYSEGAVNIIQLIDAQNNYISTQQAKTNASYNYLIQMLQLERYLGNYFLLDSQEEIADFQARFLEFIKTNEK